MDQQVSNKLRDFRKKQGLTIAEFAEKLGFKSPTGYAKIERNETEIRLKFLVTVCETFNLTLQELLELPNTSDNEYTDRLENLLQLEQLQLNAISEFCKIIQGVIKHTPDEHTVGELKNRLAHIIDVNQSQQLDQLSAQAIITNRKYLGHHDLETLLKKIIIDNASLDLKVNKLLSNQ